MEALPDGGAVVRLVRVAASENKDSGDISPYDEALIWQEYDVKKVLEGKLEVQRIRVGHWAVIRGKNVVVDGEIGKEVELRVRPFDEDDQVNLTDVVISDDLDIVADEPPRFMDMQAIMAEGLTPEAVRYDYDTIFSAQMKLYWKLRPQLELVVLGNSHAAKGIRPDRLLDEENKLTPKALNLGAGAANTDLQCLLAREYVLPLPKIKTVLWVVNSRLFNRSLRGAERRCEAFIGSPGYDFDREHHAELWPVKTGEPLVTVAELKNAELNVQKMDVWGWSARERGMKAENKERLREDLSQLNYQFDQEAWELFQRSVKDLTAKGIRVYVIISPIHPQSKDTPASDPDGSAHADLHKTVADLEAFDAGLPLMWFKDMNLNGGHDIPAEMFFDVDHLNAAGGTMLTSKVVEWMKSTQ
ncbi:hypothetical protein FEM03_14750 [Phragmitibacter flavus]|uniref:Uncharacterized protein n=1 Tax=Phragmitibacter flavus TaxID=2576071 RepID=A0A5R8KCM2_9BACT|nr:hypothetical protein [Phragmitibacter flavus]TLD69987.1 hypothetical protein FEM03_14750 [Phragmitibacter flavus]